jgi:hypothetical protein
VLAMTCRFPKSEILSHFPMTSITPSPRSYELGCICFGSSQEYRPGRDEPGLRSKQRPAKRITLCLGDGGEADPALPEGRIDTSYNTLYKLVSMSVNGPDSHVQEQNA